MDKRLKAVIGVIVFAAIIGGAHLLVNTFAGLHDDYHTIIVADDAEPLDPAPDIVVLNHAGEEVRLSDLRGTPVVLNFWTTWCPSCGLESPYFEQLYNELGDQFELLKVVILGGQGLRNETFETVSAFMENYGYTFPVHFDETGAASLAYRVRFIPMTFFINPDGYIAATIQGSANENSLRSGIEAITS